MPEAKQIARTQRLRAFCRGRKKYAVANQLKVSRPFFSYLYNCSNLDALIERIDALPVPLAEKEKA